ncbi:hypothetical protein [Paenibacillus sp. Soil522]|uniref:hypothetical protein n=1 Tax=Paenibacillus sp. Soil522 TaxID=1736388 RepID=UPI0006F3CF8C|nr:hypothetical protein [Paenibacillus sp. Soil522]KRE32557.1 hypothetical protein ASG81_23790 [Paenibacillus sp. Soil522]
MVDRMALAGVDVGVTGKLGTAERAYREWILKHTELREPTSERRRRLVERDDHSEQLFAIDIWWQVLGSFEYLHPEYEVNDYRDGSRFLDFTYIRPPFRISIEIDGFGTHQKNASRRKFSDDRFRQNQLVLDDWIVVRFSYDDLRERPRQCQQFIQQLLGKFYGLGRTDALYLQLSSPARELLRWAQRRVNGAAFSPKDARKLLWVSAPTARKNLSRLLHLKLIEQASGGQRIRSYRLTSAGVKLRL